VRIVSFIPSATELAFCLGLGDDVVGVSHECDFPPEARSRHVVVSSAIPINDMTPAQIDAAVSTQFRAGGSIYVVDTDLLKLLAPDVILAQDLCEVCAPSSSETERAIAALDRSVMVLTLAPRSLAEIHGTLRQLADATGCLDVAQTLIAEHEARLARLARELRGARRRRVFFLEWVDPIFCGGHWVPEMIDLAGGVDPLGRRGEDSVRIPFDAVRKMAPEVLIISPCGAHLDDAEAQGRALLKDSRWADLPAVRHGEVFAVDASSYFARPGPRVFDGIEVLAHLFHPDRVPERVPDSSRRLSS
jgi:iron complex transport system substrate-binding protein